MMLGLALYLRMWRRSKPYDPRTGKRIGGVARVIAYALVVSLVIGLISARKAQADSTEALKGVSRDLLALQDILGNGRELKLNGETIHVAVGPTKSNVKDTLDRFSKHCDDNAGVLGREWTNLAGNGDVPTSIPAAAITDDVPANADPNAAHKDAMKDGVVKMGTYRSGTDDEGIVLCIVQSQTSPSDLATAFKEFSRTQDLGALGKMRYAYVKRAPNGGSQVMTAWTDEHFSFKALAPVSAGADAPGNDSVIVPRLPNSQRLLAAEVAGTSYAVRVYAAPGTVTQAINNYDVAMKQRGFQPIHDDDAHPGERGYIQGGLAITMDVQPSDKGVTISFAELGSNNTDPSPRQPQTRE